MSSTRSRVQTQSPIDRSAEAFEEFYRREYSAVLTLARVLTSNRGQAEDLTQESFLAAYSAWSRISSPSAWIRATVTNKAMTGWRRVYAERRAVTRIRPAAEGGAWPTDTEDFWAEVRRLPKRQAQSLALYYLEDRATKDIAAVLGCDESTVRIHLSRGRRALALRLGVEQ